VFYISAMHYCCRGLDWYENEYRIQKFHLFIIEPAIRTAIRYLLIAENDFKSLQIYRSLQDVQYFLSVMYHNLGLTAERNQMADRHAKTEAELRRLEEGVADEEIERVLDVVASIGAALASRY
jgi:anaphase-promoting complex subunit 5